LSPSGCPTIPINSGREGRVRRPCAAGGAASPGRPRLLAPALCSLFLACLSGCGAEIPLEPGNRSPVVQSLIAFPATITLGDSAVVVCQATDPDGDQVVFDWSSDCRLIMEGGQVLIYNRGSTLVVYPGTCANAPLDTGWVRCHVRDRRGGGANAGTIHIVIRQ
jgi:hypothetical protein